MELLSQIKLNSTIFFSISAVDGHFDYPPRAPKTPLHKCQLLIVSNIGVLYFKYVHTFTQHKSQLFSVP
jgi:hypothetical protein